ncbi:MAG TPA: cyclic nucleotide-binding domain-containing protein, partial [Anaerolineales bacterium]|nr:cyclic nucleotide-binding domain-containing protein [Anaerolineales bacterium]
LAERALIEYAAHGPEAILQAGRLSRQQGFSSPSGQSLVRVLGFVPGSAAIALLLSALDSADPQVRFQSLLSLSRLGYQALSTLEILGRVRSEVVHAGWLVAALRCDDHLVGWGALRHALQTDLTDTRGRILLFLSFVYDSRAVLLARSALERRGATHSAMALETIDALLPSGAKGLILPLLEDISNDARLQRWRAAGLSVPDLNHESVLLELLSAGGASRHAAWTRMCAMHVAGSARVTACREVLAAPSGAPMPPAVEGMRLWALARLSQPPPSKGVQDMLSLVEKVLILKSAPLFAETSDRVLAELAGLVEESSFETDQIIFNKGDAGDSLYVIVSGAVKVWDGDRLLNELGEGDAFGELALLDPEPRLGTVRAAEPTHLLRLGASGFNEVLDSQPEVSSAILRVVTKYLRTQLQYAREASARIRALESLTPLAQTGAD